MLTITNLDKTYANGVHALDNVSLEIPNGMFGLLGPNGAGKSTLMRTIATLQPVDSGSIKFGAIDVLEQPDEIRRTLGYLPQDFGVYPRISAEAMLDHMAILKGIMNAKERKELVAYLLVQTNLDKVRKKALTSFSGGMRQRFGIAQALIGDPKLMIVDEPTAGLDPEERNRFHNLLAEIGESVVVILSTHIVEDVSDLCPNMAIMADGRIVASGQPADLTASLTGKIWSKTVSKEDVSQYRHNHDLISTRLYAGQTVLHIYDENDPGNGFVPVEPGLEDVYFHKLSETKTATEITVEA
ncbi:MAG: ABC transporter ATP-binding protein [Gammaproteobacteria bacterium]|nr:ABC transporter ATP-binding protein [Gammaproteobacteria bacterium]